MYSTKSYLLVLFTTLTVMSSQINKIYANEDNLITTSELKNVSENIFAKLDNTLHKYLNVNYQNNKNDKDLKDFALERLFTVQERLLKVVPTIKLLIELYDNYNVDSHKTENVTAENKEEENKFLVALLNTPTLIYVMDFLATKGYFSKNLETYKDVLNTLWFHRYSRSNSTAVEGSSGFEHVFKLEKKRNHVTGLHNWIFFAVSEPDDTINYLGYIRKKELANKAAVLRFYFSYHNKTKLSSMFVGTPPEFDIALYTLCFYARPNKNCKIQLGKTKITIKSWVQDKKWMGSAYPILY